MSELQKWRNIPEDIDEYQGFVYILRFRGKYYVGKKNFWKTVRYPPLKGYKRVRLKRRETDWKKYLGSSDNFLEFIKGHENEVEREILYPCRSKWEMSYLELKEQMLRDVLWDDDSFNNIINIRLSGNGRPKYHDKFSSDGRSEK